MTIAKKPELVVADGAFFSLALAALIKVFHGIHLLGPVKVCSALSHKQLVAALQLPDQQGFITRTLVSTHLPDIVSQWIGLNDVIPFASNRHDARGQGGRLESIKSIGCATKPNTKQAQNSKLVTSTQSIKSTYVYQFVDGVQNIGTTLPCLQLHHHISTTGLQWLKDVEATEENIRPEHFIPAGFQALTPRYLYRVSYHKCDAQNRSLRRFGCMDNYTSLFIRKFSQSLSNLTFDNAHRVWGRISGRQVTTGQFKDMVIHGAYETFAPPVVVSETPVQNGMDLTRQNSQAHDRPLIRTIDTTDLHGFSETRVGTENKRVHRGSKVTYCSTFLTGAMTVGPVCAQIGCLECSTTLPNQVFCIPCWDNYFTKFHSTSRPK